MATIIKRKKNYSVVYYYETESGEKKQKWETFTNRKDANKRKIEIENQQEQGVFVAPTSQTLEDFLYDFVNLYGEKKWSISTYDNNVSLIGNYITPIIGKTPIQNINRKFVDQYYNTLKKTKPVMVQNKQPRSEYLPPQTIERIFKLLSCAFRQAVKWELVGKNPFELSDALPKIKYKKRDIWDAETISKALDECRDGRWKVAMNLSFACSMREGEILGLTWDMVHISDEDIKADNTYIDIQKELLRVSKRTIEILDKKDIYFIFPPLMPNTSTRVVLKKPKTDSSIRRVWIPKTLAYILRDWKKHQDELKEFLGNEYQDFNLVVALQNGRPCEGRVLLKSFEELRTRAKLPNVVFHSLRHSSTTYKLKLNHGDIKATQGDTGHAQTDMITEIYSHILVEDRKVNAQKFEAAFYKNPDLRKSGPPASDTQTNSGDIDLNVLIKKLKDSPELATTLAQLLVQ